MESVIIEITSKNGKNIIIGSMYRPPNTQVEQFSKHIKEIVNQARDITGKSMPEIVLGMDHNIDLPKGVHHAPTHEFIELMSELNLLPMITRHTTWQL